jgi:hydrogenase-4 component B
MIAVLLSFSAVGTLAALLVARWTPRLWRILTLAWLGALMTASLAVLTGGDAWEWHPAWGFGGEAIHLRLDALSAFFAALLAAVGGAATVYSSAYWPDAEHPRSAPAGRLWWTVLLGSLAVVLLQSNGLHFLIAWELFTLAAYFLITLDRRAREIREAGWLYLAASHVGTLCLFAFFALLAVRVGGWDLGPMRERAELAPLFWLALAGFGLKSGMFPLHVWLPSAHANAPSHVSAILSGVTIKVGIYALLRFSGWLPVPEAAAWTIVAAGLASAVLGVAFALGQHDIKRLLAYHSVENIGIILIGFGFALIASANGGAAWGRLAIAGALLHVWNHGLFKSLLFLGAGSVVHGTGTREMSRLGGLWRAMPWTAGCFVLGAAAISGLPPLNGFVSEWLIFIGLFDAASAHGPDSWAALPGAVLLGITGAMALACFVKVCGVVFLGVARSESAARAHEPGWAMRGPMLALAAACVAIGLAPGLFYGPVARAAAAWDPGFTPGPVPAPLLVLGTCHLVLAGTAIAAAAVLWARVRRNGVRREVTWDCGYAAPSPRMQYTAGSFAGIITRWFAWILRPSHHGHAPEGVFPAHASHAVRTPETVLEKWIGPVAHGVMAISSAVRRLQHGRVQAYLFYLVVGSLLVALVALAGGAR